MSLTRDEELTLFARHRAGDKAAANAIVRANAHLVSFAVRQFQAHRDHEDLEAEGYVGLTIAMRKFDPARGSRFSTFAVPWIRYRVFYWVVRYMTTVRIVGFAGRPDAYFRVRRAAYAVREGIRTVEDVAAEFGRTPAEIHEAFAQMNLGHGHTAYVNWDDLHDVLRDRAPTPSDVAEAREEHDLHAEVAALALDCLDAREALIIRARIMADDEETLLALGKQLGVSRERVRQIERAALTKMRKALSRASENNP